MQGRELLATVANPKPRASLPRRARPAARPSERGPNLLEVHASRSAVMFWGIAFRYVHDGRELHFCKFHSGGRSSVKIRLALDPVHAGARESAHWRSQWWPNRTLAWKRGWPSQHADQRLLPASLEVQRHRAMRPELGVEHNLATGYPAHLAFRNQEIIKGAPFSR